MTRSATMQRPTAAPSSSRLGRRGCRNHTARSPVETKRRTSSTIAWRLASGPEGSPSRHDALRRWNATVAAGGPSGPPLHDKRVSSPAMVSVAQPVESPLPHDAHRSVHPRLGCGLGKESPATGDATDCFLRDDGRGPTHRLHGHEGRPGARPTVSETPSAPAVRPHGASR